MSRNPIQSRRPSFFCTISRHSFQIPTITRSYSSNIPPSTQSNTPPPPPSSSQSSKRPIDVHALLSTPSWSVRSLLPSETSPISAQDEITPQKLHHLLRLSALPLPKSASEEESMLSTLHSQLHFVRSIQSVNTDGVKPLQSIRDETEEGEKEVTIGLESLKEALGKEETRGRNRRPRRIRANEGKREDEYWDVLGCAGDVVSRGGGRYFVVRSGKGPLKPGEGKKEEDGSRDG